MIIDNFGRKISRIQHISLRIMLRNLVDGPCTVAELREETGLAESTIRAFLKELTKGSDRLVQICGALPNSRGERRTLQFRWNPDSKHVYQPKSGAEKSRAYRQRVKMRKLAQAIAGEVKETT